MDETGFSNNEKASNPGEDTQHLSDVDQAEVNVFFDGTANNYYNVTADAAHKISGEESYANALSNIARMWTSLDIDPQVMALYVEGAGTKRYEADSTIGLALATGDTGIDLRVKDAFTKLVTLVVERRKSSGLPATLDINVFGFSRGAAAARYFVHLANTEKKRRFGTDWEKVKIRCKFVGLFDTVSSYGANHSNDVEQLHLNFEANYASKVFHLIAGDEYRLNFSVTTIASAVNLKVQTHTGKAAMGYELRIPGAHSDVGGGYNDTEIEKRTLDPFIRDFVYDQGWYDASLQTDAFWHTHERKVSGEYHKVGLALMVDQAHLHSTTRFPPELLEPPNDADIQDLYNTLREFAKDEKNIDWSLTKNLGTDKAKALRKKFMHQSFSKGAMVPRLFSESNSSRSGESSSQIEPHIPVREYFVG